MRMQVTARSVFGETKLYPACAAARAYAEALGTKTLTRRAIDCAGRMGFTVVVDGDRTLAALLAEVA